MTFYIIVGIVVLVAIIASIFLNPKESKSDKNYKFKSRGQVLTHNELNFYQSLINIMPSNIYLLSKVRLLDIIEPDETGKRSFGARQKINSRHVDFLLIEKTTSKILGVIELDDSTHQKSSRKKADLFLNNVLEQANIPIKRFSVQKAYNVEQLRTTLFG